MTGGTGFLGQSLIRALVAKEYSVCALVRSSSEDRLPSTVEKVVGDALRHDTFQNVLASTDTFVQLVGVRHPSPLKAKQFREIDLRSARESIQAAKAAQVKHVVYLSVASPAPTMHAYVNVRRQVEEEIRLSGLNATFIRPWYVLGPGRRWPMVFLPLFWLFERIPATRDAAQRLGFVTDREMTAALVHAVEHPPTGIQILDVPAIRRIAKE